MNSDAWEAEASRISLLSPATFAERHAAIPSRKDRDTALRMRLRHDRALFMRLMFPDTFSAPWSPVHLEFFGRAKIGWRHRRRPSLIADLAPRKSSKTTLEHKGDLLHDLVYGLEVCTLIYSTTYPDSERIVKAIYDVLKQPAQHELFHALYGPFALVGTQTEFAAFCPGGEPLGSQYAAKSFGGSGRGHLYRSRRPSKVGMDDVVHPQHVQSAKQRDDDWGFLNKDVLKSGDTYTIYRMLNTVQHRDDTTSRAQRDPNWRCTKWKALISWPTNMDLWERCRVIWSNLDNGGAVVVDTPEGPVSMPARLFDAMVFYEEHREAMDMGSSVLWPARRPLFDLMVDYWSNPASFHSEDQNEPHDPGRSVFNVARFRRVHFDGLTITMKNPDGTDARKIAISDCDWARWLDPSLGKDTSDYPALATVVRERRTGYRFVLRCDMTKGPPSSQRQRVWREFERHPGGKWGTDATGLGALFDEGYEREKQERKRQGKPWMMNMVGFKASEGQTELISRLEPDTLNGWLQFADDLDPVGIDQFADHPNAKHDDGPSSIERADWLLTGESMPTASLHARGL